MQYVPLLDELDKFVIACLEDGKQRCCSKYEYNSRGMDVKRIYWKNIESFKHYSLKLSVLISTMQLNDFKTPN